MTHARIKVCSPLVTRRRNVLLSNKITDCLTPCMRFSSKLAYVSPEKRGFFVVVAIKGELFSGNELKRTKIISQIHYLACKPYSHCEPVFCGIKLDRTLQKGWE